MKVITISTSLAGMMKEISFGPVNWNDSDDPPASEISMDLTLDQDVTGCSGTGSIGSSSHAIATTSPSSLYLLNP